ncbi:hypothetical protein I7I48_01047 [Histoplasma ohiense]|nr:hypothetical protein I7I48_01047 [Histoplasma ohiense (nom. inval.)]
MRKWIHGLRVTRVDIRTAREFLTRERGGGLCTRMLLSQQWILSGQSNKIKPLFKNRHLSGAFSCGCSLASI